MAKKMLIDATHAEETRVVVVDGNKVEEFDFETENRRQLAGNIYLAKITRVEPSLQAAFVDYGGNRHGFLAFNEIHPDYYQIPVADREALMEEERAYVEAQRARDEDEEDKPKRRRSSRSKASRAKTDDAVETREVAAEVDGDVSGMETIDFEEGDDTAEGLSPMELVGDTPVEEPDDAVEAESGDDASEEVSEESGELSDDEDGAPKGRSNRGKKDASAKDETIESVAEDDEEEDIRPPRKPRPRRYKIQEVVKVRQIMLVQVVKEERGNKGAALTTYLSLAGRYCVLMPNTARGGGISRKITNPADRKKLKEIAHEIEVPKGAGLIVRTAGAKRTKTEIKRDYEYLQRLWEQIRELTLKSTAPSKIYEEGDLIKRSIRDLYSREIDEVLVEGERGYRIAKDFMKMIMPSHSKNVQRYEDSLPLFARYQVESYLSGMFNPTVQLKSGGYIVFGVTEALVAVDVNSGRATKESSIEETALKTNLEAAEEVARQLRLRDLAGLIVIDFIDMDERRNNAAVEKRMKDKLKSDRARIQVGRISGFGLMEMSRQRLRPGMLEATTQPCPSCHGTGLIRSDDNLALSVLRQIEEEGTRRRSREVLVTCPVGIANFLMNQKREHVAHIEARYGMSVRIEGDPKLISPDFTLEKFKTATRNVKEMPSTAISASAALMDDIDSEVTDEIEENTSVEVAERVEENGEGKPKKRRRRRPRRRGKGNGGENGAENDSENGGDSRGTDGHDAQTDKPVDADKPNETPQDAPAKAVSVEVSETVEDAPKKKTVSRSRKKKTDTDEPVNSQEAASAEIPAAVDDGAPKKATRKPSTRAKKPKADEVEASDGAQAPAEEKTAKPKTTRSRAKKKVDEPEVEAPATVEPATKAEPAPKPAPKPKAAPEPAPEVKDDAPPKPKKKGWWSLGG
ncbi:Rne/Rng family ribonuclease [Lentibacter sp. XHP0401]|uniref:Rne/Rng family ribonuclease n=1 Tax=Lentibacter sp. XHP0401 TaxID=2984334 RepID=UPI0021E7C2A4|nr:Rne/Rng family ribonuclease [Lentibacter sp. XHP0401]MCV2892198.1 Rne/Rng family ribonuclease [Lentibacter sp. XHP0401]